MDNNNPVSQPQPDAPLPQTPLASSPQVEGDSKQMIFWLVGGLVVIILVVGGIYWYLNNKSASTTSRIETSSPAVAKKQENLDQELDSVTVSDVNADFTEVDKDLQNL